VRLGTNQRESVFRKLLVRLVIDSGGVALNRAGNRISPNGPRMAKIVEASENVESVKI
jgi:hypothetical protein